MLCVQRAVRSSLEVLRPGGIENARIRDRLQRGYSALGQNQEEFGTRASAEGTGGRSVALEAGVSRLEREAFVFPDAKGGFMDTGNHRRRVLEAFMRWGSTH